jgi:hypothetical protein
VVVIIVVDVVPVVGVQAAAVPTLMLVMDTDRRAGSVQSACASSMSVASPVARRLDVIIVVIVVVGRVVPPA